MSDPTRVPVVLLRRLHALRDVGLALAVVGWTIPMAIRDDTRVLWFIGLGCTGAFLALLGLEGGVRRVAASLGAEGICVGDKVIAPRRTIRSGWVERSFEGSRVHVHRGILPDVEIEAEDDAEARALLRALACDPSQTVVAFPSVHRLFGLAIGSAGALGQLSGHALLGGPDRLSASRYLVSAVCWLLWYFLLFVLVHGETTVGSDGVLVSGLLRRRFVPFAALESAVVESAGKLVLHMHGGDRLARRMRGPAAEAAAELIQSAVRCPKSGSEAVRQQLGRAREGIEGDVGAWLARLRALTAREPYRAAACGGDALWRVVDDPVASGAERAAAAVVLGAAATPAERVRLRRAAARVASPRVRVAIERAADGAAGRGPSAAEAEAEAEAETQETELMAAETARTADDELALAMAMAAVADDPAA